MPQPEPPPVTRKKEPLATTEQCDRLLGHMLELELAVTGKTIDPVDKQAHIDRQRDEFQSVCNTTPAARIECALRAVDLAGIEKCDQQ